MPSFTIPSEDNDTVDSTAAESATPEEFRVPESTEDNGAKRSKFMGASFDDAVHAAEAKKLMAPAGDWLKDEPWDFEEEKNIRVNPDDCAPGDIDPDGRTSITMWGYPKARYDKEGNEFKPFTRFFFSPDRRDDPKDPSKPDFAYRMFIAVRAAYIYTRDKKLTDTADLIDFLANDNYVLATSQSKDGGGLFVFAIKGERKEKAR